MKALLVIIMSFTYLIPIAQLKNNKLVVEKDYDPLIFYKLNKSINFETIWKISKKGIFDGQVKTLTFSKPNFDVNFFTPDDEFHNYSENKKFKVFKDCSDIYAFNKSTKKYFQIWTVVIYALRNCGFTVELIENDIVKINNYSDNTNVYIDLNTLKYRVVIE